MSIPTIDIQFFQLPTDANAPVNDDVFHISKDIAKALIDVGFFYVRNHSIPADLIQACLQQSQQFFALADDSKWKIVRDWEKSRCGYIPMKGDVAIEYFDKNKPRDQKEVLDVCHQCHDSNWPEQLPAFKLQSLALIEAVQNLILRILYLTAVGLELPDPHVFLNLFEGFGTEKNTSQLRYLFYPSLNNSVPDGAMRCGEHTDYGCITLVLTDTAPGLQVFTRDNQYVDVQPLDTILVNIGDLMQRWTGDKLRSAKHRVIFRPDTKYQERYSLVYFSHPDDHTIIVPVTGDKDRYPPVRTDDHMDRRFKDTFVDGKGLDEELTGLKPPSE